VNPLEDLILLLLFIIAILENVQKLSQVEKLEPLVESVGRAVKMTLNNRAIIYCGYCLLWPPTLPPLPLQLAHT
jgi:hypothetical protein